MLDDNISKLRDALINEAQKRSLDTDTVLELSERLDELILKALQNQ
ncbi:aspartyl-phosphate phosphatase Spo0E family protein [Anaerobacterium chartisolvens]|nr:aspartyl-phosphate phosphatase Spo0E family protein [Anaerobacterium chartisolvens]